MDHPSYQRLIEVLKTLGESTIAADIARRLNTSDQTVTNWKSRGVSKDALITLSDELGFRIGYIQNGEGEMFHGHIYKINSPEHKALAAMQQMDDPTKYQAVRLLNTLAEPTEDKNGNHKSQ